MGTYYMAVNHTKRQKINPHDLNEGAKLGEAQAAKDLLWRLLAGGAWEATDQVEVISDYGGDRWDRCDREYTEMRPEDGEL